MRQVAHVLLTRPPLASLPKKFHSLDLHVLGTPPAFVLSQDQTLIKYEYLISQINFLFNLPLSLLAVLLFFQCTVYFCLATKACL